MVTAVIITAAAINARDAGDGACLRSWAPGPFATWCVRGGAGGGVCCPPCTAVHVCRYTVACCNPCVMHTQDSVTCACLVHMAQGGLWVVASVWDAWLDATSPRVDMSAASVSVIIPVRGVSWCGKP